MVIVTLKIHIYIRYKAPKQFFSCISFGPQGIQNLLISVPCMRNNCQKEVYFLILKQNRNGNLYVLSI